MTPLERAARELYRTGDFDPHEFGEDAVWPDLAHYVRIVLLAIREPTTPMVITGDRTFRGSIRFDKAALAWRAMIDAIDTPDEGA